MAPATVDSPPTGSVHPTRSGPPPRTVLIVGAALLLSLVLVALVAAFLTGAPRGRAPGIERVVSGPVDGVTRATFELVSGVTSVTVRGADLGTTLYRIETPEGSPLRPGVVRTGDRVEAQLRDVGGPGVSAVLVHLNVEVRWRVRLTAGASSSTVDLRRTPIESVDFVGGASVIDLTLPRPSGTVVVRMSGGAGQFNVHAPDGVPVRVRAGGGAGSVLVDGAQHGGVAGGTVLAPPGWDTATERYDLDNTAGVASMTVDRVA